MVDKVDDKRFVWGTRPRSSDLHIVKVYIPNLMNYMPHVTWKSLTLYVLPRHGSVMTLLELNAPSVDTPVLDVTEIGMVVELHCLYQINLSSILQWHALMNLNFMGHYKTWTLDSGLDHGLDSGLNNGLDN